MIYLAIASILFVSALVFLIKEKVKENDIKKQIKNRQDYFQKYSFDEQDIYK